MASLIHKVGHGLSAGDAFKFANVLPTDAGIDETSIYYVLATGLTADAFEFSESVGGANFTLSFDIESGDVFTVDEYQETTHPAMPAPEAPDTPAAPSLGSTVFANIVQMKVTL